MSNHAWSIVLHSKTITSANSSKYLIYCWRTFERAITLLGFSRNRSMSSQLLMEKFIWIFQGALNMSSDRQKMDCFVISLLCSSSEAFSTGIWVTRTLSMTQYSSACVLPFIMVIAYHSCKADKAGKAFALHPQCFPGV